MRILLVEDDLSLGEGIRTALRRGAFAVDWVQDGASGLLALRGGGFDLVVLDLGLPRMDGIEVIRQLRAADPSMGILVISAWSTEDAILSALRAGANGYVLKERDDLEVMLSIRSVLRGGAPIDPFIARRIIAELQAPASTEAQKDVPPEAVLSSREIQILKLVADGMTNREIAETLFLSRYTVECHVKNIYRKLAVPSRTKAISEARARGLLS